MTSRRFPKILVASAAAAVVVAMAAPASGAIRGPSKPSAKSVFAKSATSQHSAGLFSAAEATGGHDTDAGEAESVKLRGEFEQSITAAPGVVAPTAGLVAAQAAGAALPVSPGSWDEVTDKPFLNDPVDRGANFGVGYGNVTGRMTGLTHSGSTVYAASASGGVWRSTNDGKTWTEVNAGLPRLSIGAIATDPSDGSVWAGTGEANNASENQYGVGVFRLAKGSSTWQQVGGTELYGAGAFRIVWINGYVYAATSHGLYRRAVGAAQSSAWRLALAPAGVHDYPPSSSVTDVIALPGSNGAKVLAVVGWAGYSVPPATFSNGFYVGTGGSGSFARVTPTGDINPKEIGRTTFSSVARLVVRGRAGHRERRPARRGRRSCPSRATRPVRGSSSPTPTSSTTPQSALGDYTSSTYYPGIQSDYNQNIVADPADPKHVYLQLEEVYESTNGGQSWLAVAPYWNYDIPCDANNNHPYSCPGTAHSDQHAGMIYNGQFWTGSDGGVWRRPVDWHLRGRWTNLNATLYTTQNYSIAVGKVGGGLAYWGGLQDNGESYTTTKLRKVQQAFTGDGGDTIVDPKNGNRAVEEYVDLDMYVTTDGAVNDLREISPSCLTATSPPALCDPNPRFIAPIEMDVNNTRHWVAGGQYVWNDTKAWNTVCSGAEGKCDWKVVYDTGTGHQVTALADNGPTTYAAWCGGCNPPTFARGMATNFGGTWHELALAGVPNRYITSIAVDPNNAAHVFISIGSFSRRWIPDAGVGHVFESWNGGASFTDVTGNLPDAPVFKVAMHGSQLVAGTEVGAFVADQNNGSPMSWEQLGTGLPNVTVWDLTITSSGLVVAGTHGRGDWQIKLH